MKKTYKIIIFFLLAIGFNLFLLNPSQAKNDCKREGCKITITINMVFVGATQAQIDKWVQEIESTWDSPTTGKCKCDVSFKVSAKTASSCTHADAQGSHCLEVTVQNPRDNNNRIYTAFMWGISQLGSSINGKWGPNTSGVIPGSITIGSETYTPATTGETYVDAAHEAGHMLGLPDEYDAAAGSYPNNLMGRTWGATAKPNQGHIDKAISNNCKGEDAKCPDECCCGRNGKVDTDPKEECDPSAQPTGCGEMESCTKDCKCVKMKATPICGDGYITTPEEECDPKATPQGCPADKDCVGCKCQPKPTPPPITSAPQPPQVPEPNTPGDGTTPPSQSTPADQPTNGGSVPTPTDTDQDGIADADDNCPNASNPDQADSDIDDIGDACDPCTDKDKDGYSQEGGNCGPIDCNDNNPNINPGMAEDCADGIDNDCDGKIDFADTACSTMGADSDGDGIMDAQDNCPDVYNPDQADWDQDGMGDACDFCIDIDHDGYSQEGGNCGLIDCDDHNAAIYPGKLEVCGDGIDNNCNGLIDENCQQEPTCGDGFWDPAIEQCDALANPTGCPMPLICLECICVQQ